jgi:hypothetical protein
LDVVVAAAVIVNAIGQLGALIIFIVAALRSLPRNPEVEERALMRSLSWPTTHDDRQR